VLPPVRLMRRVRQRWHVALWLRSAGLPALLRRPSPGCSRNRARHSAIRHLVTEGGFGQFGVLGADGGQPEHPARLATKLVNELVEASDEKLLAKTIARYGRVDLLCIDELGYMELDRRGAELLFQVLTERGEKNSVAIASNESFELVTRSC